jgi:heavy metal sensor kinase
VNLPIRARVTVWYGALFALVLVALGAFVVVRLRTDLISGLDASLASRAAQISLGFRGSGEGEFEDVSGASLRGLPGGESAAQLLDRSGAVLETSGDASANDPMIDVSGVRTALAGSPVVRSVELGADRESFRVLAVRLPDPRSDVIVVGTSLDAIEASVARLRSLFLIAGPVLLGVVALGGWWIAGSALSPLARIGHQAAGIGIDRLDERVDVPSSADEVHRLAVTMNGMLDRLQRGVQDQRRFVADASHELRTPLAVMLAELDVSLRDPRLDTGGREVLESVRMEVAEMAATVEDMLTLARADEGQLLLSPERIDLRTVVLRVERDLAPMARAADVRVRLEGPGAPVVADPRRIEQVVRNLVSNAIRYVGAGGHVTVGTQVGQGTVGCVVRDDGPGIEAAALPHVFDRFYRSDTARAQPGNGLGLAICREIVVAHRGAIHVDSRVGAGSSFTFSIPAS